MPCRLRKRCSAGLESTPEDFQFCFKFPRTITHDKHLQKAEGETVAFLERMAPLGPRLGPFLLQLPPSFGRLPSPPSCLISTSFPTATFTLWKCVISSFLPKAKRNESLTLCWLRRGINRAVFDTRALRNADPSEKAVFHVHQKRKPDLQVNFLTTGSRPFYRYVGHPQLEANLPYLQELADWTAHWIDEGHTPYIFMHSVYDDLVPEQSRLFHSPVEPAPGGGRHTTLAGGNRRAGVGAVEFVLMELWGPSIPINPTPTAE